MRRIDWISGVALVILLIVWVAVAGCTLQIRATELEIDGELVKRYEFEGIKLDGFEKSYKKAYAGPGN